MKTSFQTSDGVIIFGDWSQPEGAKRAVLLLHMMPALRVSWLPLTRALNEAGFATLAIDLRGHGESTAQSHPERSEGSPEMLRGVYTERSECAQHDKTLDYKTFTDSEHQSNRLDVDAAVNFLKSNNFEENAISFAGASIGANLSLDALARYAGAQKAVLLSPGLDYRGVKTDTAIRNLSATQKVWIVAAEDDTYSADSTRELGKMRPDVAKITIFPGAEHGTNLFEPHPNLIEEILRFAQDDYRIEALPAAQ